MAGEGAMGARMVAVTITNTTARQSFSAPVVLAHDRSYIPFALGEPAYPELIPLAEDGKIDDLLTVAKVEPAILDYAVADGPLAPGRSVTLQVRVDDAHPLLSAFAMMVTTNDTVFYYGADLSMTGASSSGAMGQDGMASGGMDAGSEPMGTAGMGAGPDAAGADGDAMGPQQAAAGGEAMMPHIDLYDGTVRALDAGSEANTESCQDVPGPPCGSVGVRHTDMAEGTVAVSAGLTGDGDLDAGVYGWEDPVARVSLAAP